MSQRIRIRAHKSYTTLVVFVLAFVFYAACYANIK